MHLLAQIGVQLATWCKVGNWRRRVSSSPGSSLVFYLHQASRDRASVVTRRRTCALFAFIHPEWLVQSAVPGPSTGERLIFSIISAGADLPASYNADVVIAVLYTAIQTLSTRPEMVLSFRFELMQAGFKL